MTRDKMKALEIQSAVTPIYALLRDVEGFEKHADAGHANLHAVLYGKVADLLSEAQEALREAAMLLDPDLTDVAV